MLITVEKLIACMAEIGVKSLRVPTGDKALLTFADKSPPHEMDALDLVRKWAWQDYMVHIVDQAKAGKLTVRSAIQIPEMPPPDYPELLRYFVRVDDARSLLAELFGDDSAAVAELLDVANDAETAEPTACQEHARTIADDGSKLAALFDPIKMEQLEVMFPDGGKWAKYTERAKRGGLKECAKVGRGLFNPYYAAEWWLKTGPTGWDWARCLRKLANNLPPRSRDSKCLLTGEYE